MWRCRRMEHIHWIDRMKKKYSLQWRRKEHLAYWNRRQINWIRYILRKNTLLKQRQKGREKKKEDVSSYWMTLGKEKIPDVERGSTRSHSVENSLWKSLRTCRQTDYVIVTDLINVRMFRCLFNGTHILYRIERM